MKRRKPGTVHLVGAGPGDPSLLTLRAAELLRIAHTVVYDRLVHPEILGWASSGTRLLFVGKEKGEGHAKQEEINTLLIAQARLGRDVVRLKGGDPFVFGRGGDEALALVQAGIPFTVVPGVSSGIAAPAYAGIPVTHRGVSSSVTFATGHCAAGSPDWKHLAGSPTLVLFMGLSHLAQATTELIRAGASPTTPAAMIQAGSWEHQRVVQSTLRGITARALRARLESPSLLVVGEVVRLRSALAPWTRALMPALRVAGAR